MSLPGDLLFLESEINKLNHQLKNLRSSESTDNEVLSKISEELDMLILQYIEASKENKTNSI